MKIAIPTQNSNVDDHFGHCEYYTVFTVNDSKQIEAADVVTAPVGCGCKSNVAQILSQMGVTVLLAGNMGGGAVNALTSQGIDVYRGCSGDVKSVAMSWLEGSLADSGDTCQAHEHGCH